MAGTEAGHRENLAYRCETTVPQSASTWKREHLESLGIFYAEQCCSVGNLVSRLKNRSSRRLFSELPTLCPAIIRFMKEFWDFTIELGSVQKDVVKVKEVLEILRTKLKVFSMHEGIFKEDRENRELLRDIQNFRIFRTWCTNMENFLKILDVFLRSYSLSQGEVLEGNFTDLFSKFTMTCLLLPQAGYAIKGEKNVQGVHVSNIPAVRFPKLLEDVDETVQVVSVTGLEEDNHGNSHSGERFSINNLPSRVLGQHGADLLVEMSRSYFRPVVTGMICIGTKIIFTYLDMDVTHAKKIRDNEELRGCQSVISYTRPYDFLNATDREEILEPLMWFGYVQSIVEM